MVAVRGRVFGSLLNVAAQAHPLTVSSRRFRESVRRLLLLFALERGDEVIDRLAVERIERPATPEYAQPTVS
jgi:hypothetical protein